MVLLHSLVIHALLLLCHLLIMMHCRFHYYYLSILHCLALRLLFMMMTCRCRTLDDYWGGALQRTVSLLQRQYLIFDCCSIIIIVILLFLLFLLVFVDVVISDKNTSNDSLFCLLLLLLLPATFTPFGTHLHWRWSCYYLLRDSLF